MKSAKPALIVFLLLLGFISLKAQVILSSGSKIETPPEYYLKVKQFGEFIDRFNYTSDWKGQLITEEFSQRVPRAEYLKFLINAEDSRLNNPADSSYRLLCNRFIDFTIAPENPQKISLYQGQVKAWVKARIVFTGKEHLVDIEMIPEVLPDRSAKWSINKVVTDCFSSVTDSMTTHFIAPNSHETGFINLNKLNGTSNPAYFLSKGLATDPTLLFVTELAENRLKVKTIEHLVYFITFPGYEITVEEFNRDFSNSGWIISNIMAVTE